MAPLLFGLTFPATNSELGYAFLGLGIFLLVFFFPVGFLILLWLAFGKHGSNHATSLIARIILAVLLIAGIAIAGLLLVVIYSNR